MRCGSARGCGPMLPGNAARACASPACRSSPTAMSMPRGAAWSRRRWPAPARPPCGASFRRASQANAGPNSPRWSTGCSPRGWIVVTIFWRSAAGSSAISPALPPPSSSAAASSSRSPPHCWPKSIHPSAAKRRSMRALAKTSSAPFTSRRWCWPIRPCVSNGTKNWAQCASASSRCASCWRKNSPPACRAAISPTSRARTACSPIRA